MPQLGPAFLHQSISSLPSLNWRAAMNWWLEGLQIAAPRGVRELGLAKKETVIEFRSAARIETLGIVKQSMLGERRFDSTEDPTENLPVSVALDDSLIFETEIELPVEARASLQDTVSLRLEELSPIPPKEAAFAIGLVTKNKSGRIRADIAIARKTTINDAEQAFKGKLLSCIGAKINASAQPKYSFRKHNTDTRNSIARWGLAIASLWAALILLAMSVDHRSARNMAALQTYESEIFQEIRRLRADSERIEALAAIAPPTTAANEAESVIKNVVASLPTGSVLEGVSLFGANLLVEGLVPSNGYIMNPTLSLSRSPSIYPGYDNFQADHILPLKVDGGAR